MANVTYTVKKGDTLTAIAKKYETTVKKIASLNHIKDVNRIYVGQKLIISGTAAAKTSTSSSSVSKAVIEQFGLQSDTETTMFATWAWSKSNTLNYETRWYYDTGNGVWFNGDSGTTEYKQSVYSAPSNAKRVKFKVKPISKTHTVRKKTTAYWTADWSTEKIFSFSEKPPSTPSTPSIKIEEFTLTATLENLNVNATNVQFQVVRDDTSVFKTINSEIKTNSATASCTVTAGSDYKVRARSYKGNEYSDWSEYSSNAGTTPSTPGNIDTIMATSKTSIYLSWPSVKNAKTYEIEYATEKRYLEGSNNTTTVGSIENNHYEITGMETGHSYFFRVRAVNEQGKSSWSEIASIIIGKDPAAPTTWSSTTTCIVGETLNLYWVHNSEDGSSQTFAELELTINGSTKVYTIQNTTDEDEKDKTSVYSISTSSYTEGVKILWRVRTAGITKVYGDWSVQRTVDIYAPPTVEIKVTDKSGSLVDTLNQFPFYVYALAGPNTQAPTSYSLTITSNDKYETTDEIGNVKIVNKGDAVYSKFFDIKTALTVEMSAGNIDLQNNVNYTVTVVVSMNSGLTAEDSHTFGVSWTDEEYGPNAEIGVDPKTLTAHIRPYCTHYPTVYKVVSVNSAGKYVDTGEVLTTNPNGTPIDDTMTPDEDQVYLSGSTYYYIGEGSPVLVNGITLSVYRREFDGTFTEIATGLKNTNQTYVTDPHPSLDYARYRIVAITDSTGAVSYYDVPGYPVEETAVVIQWDEEWSNFDVVEEDEAEQPAYSGSMLKLPYNIDVSDSHSPDVSLVEYIGRSHPVSYYGTQKGETASWNVEIEKSDIDTLYTLRRLAIYQGDVYVREPSGSGYWAHIKVSISQKHTELTIPVSLDITRVEGGM